MTRKTLQPAARITLRNLEFKDFGVAFALGIFSYGIFMRYVELVPLRYLMTGVVTFMSMSVYVHYKYMLPPQYLRNLRRWIRAPQLWLVAPDPHPKPLVIELSIPERRIDPTTGSRQAFDL
jgi:hypothetical protein